MNSIVSCYSCPKYDVEKILPLLEKIYDQSQGSDLEGKTVLIKPNILSDDVPEKAVTTHPVFVEAVIRFVQSRRPLKILVGDSPAMHTASFQPNKSGIFEVCEKTGVEWAYFGKKTTSLSLPSGKTPITHVMNEVDYFISLPKLKTHELMGYTGAIKNNFGLIPHLHKAKQHAFHRSSQSMAAFLIDLVEAVTPDFIFLDAITAMEGPGPANGFPFPLHWVLGSTNPLAIDLIASKIIGYDPLQIPTNTEGLKRKKWMNSIEEIIVKGEPIEQYIRKDFQLIHNASLKKTAKSFIVRYIPGLKPKERIPVFIKNCCTGCKDCVRICPVQAIHIHPNNPKKVVLTPKKCIHCFCCHEVCKHHAIEIK